MWNVCLVLIKLPSLFTTCGSFLFLVFGDFFFFEQHGEVTSRPCTFCLFILKASWLVRESIEILRPTKKVYWRSARWTSENSEFKSEWFSCDARLMIHKTLLEIKTYSHRQDSFCREQLNYNLSDSNKVKLWAWLQVSGSLTFKIKQFIYSLSYYALCFNLWVCDLFSIIFPYFL